MIRKNLATIRRRIAEAALRVNRSPDDIKLVAVSKHVTPENILQAFSAGHTTFGENYVQEAEEKISLLKKENNSIISFHLIGKLQSNKARKAVQLFDVIETVDSIKLARALEKHLQSLNKTMPAFLQVNVGRETQKAGVLPEDCSQLLQEFAQFHCLQIVGLMTMPPYCPNPEDVRPYFKELRKLAEDLTTKKLLGQHNSKVELSMGMSGDFEVAIEEGATVIRIGTAIFGSRDR